MTAAPVGVDGQSCTGSAGPRLGLARANNLKGVDVDIPTAVLTVVSGVAGSGMRALTDGVFLPDHPDAIALGPEG
jgi:excinuclease UvrABC ATPase subunit